MDNFKQLDDIVEIEEKHIIEVERDRNYMIENIQSASNRDYWRKRKAINQKIKDRLGGVRN